MVTYTKKVKSERRGGRPPKPIMLDRQVSVRFPPHYFIELREVSDGFRLPVSTVVRNLVMDYLDNLRKERENVSASATP